MSRVIIITGGYKGLGLYITKRFLKNGDTVIILSREPKLSTNLKKSLREYSGKHYNYKLDITDVNKTIKTVRKIIDRFKKIDVLINNAGVIYPVGRFDKLNFKEIRYNLDVNLLGAINLMHSVINYMSKRRNGKIINISGGGAVKPLKEMAIYSASKTALVRISEVLSIEFMKFNININCIAPGFLNTGIHNQILDENSESSDSVKKEIKNKLSNKIDDPNLTSNLCFYLASQDSNHINGKLISAIYDDLEKYQNSESFFTLRRIDNVFYKEILKEE